MTQIAVVNKITGGGYALVDVERVSACGHNCASCGSGCSGGHTVSVSAKNTVNAAPGDTVVIESGTSSVLKAAALVYLLPVAVFLAAYFIADALFKAGDNVCAAVSITGFVLGCVLIAVINKYVRRDRELEFFIISIKV